MDSLGFGFPAKSVDRALVVQADCLAWLTHLPADHIHAVVTDPPYGVKEFQTDQLEKREKGSGGIWRIPPAFDGSTRSPLPRFTALTEAERETLKAFYTAWAKQIVRVLRPGGHVFFASNTYLSQSVFAALVAGGLEFRGEIVRLVQTLRGGDRPKNAEQEFPDVSTMPRGSYEPWGLFRKPLPTGMRVSDCLRVYQTGGLRRLPDGRPFGDVIPSQRTPKTERAIAPHPSLKPQSFLRQLVYAALPLSEGVILDPFMGSGSTIAAANAVGVDSIGIEKHIPYYEMSLEAIPRLARIVTKQAEQAKQLSLLLE
ncbi:MAG: site-specific DNA-methyltransferase [Anaerolineae bacterium]|nr:site-specific DNA-methyltransferase [Anaerolineae bacterium]